MNTKSLENRFKRIDYVKVKQLKSRDYLSYFLWYLKEIQGFKVEELSKEFRMSKEAIYKRIQRLWKKIVQ